MNFLYQESKLFYKVIKDICKLFECKDKPLYNQTIRASLSVILNIAEGSAKQSDKDFARYLEISIASMNEVVACLDVMKDENYISKDVFEKLVSKSESITKQLGGFIKQLRKS